MKSTLFLSLLVISCQVFSAVDYGNVTVSEVRTVTDGDTFKANIHGWPDVIGKSISIRIKGIDTPELRGKCPQEKRAARKAKQFTVQQLRAAEQVELRNISRGKYFRLIADVYIDGENLGELLLRNELARLYEGGRRGGWCGSV